MSRSIVSSAFVLISFFAGCLLAMPQELGKRGQDIPRLQRRALVVGMASYQSTAAQRLDMAIHDARVVNEILKDLGFQVNYVEDATRIRLDIAIDEFQKEVSEGDVALVYYAGHGMQIRGENYLIPVDYDAVGEADAAHQAYPVSAILERLRRKNVKLSILVLDACRTNPFLPRDSAVSGLAKIDAAEFPGTYVAMATSPDKITPDNGLFAEQLVNALKKPALSLDEVFNEVRKNVSERTSRAQVPSSWSTSDIGQFTFRDQSQAEYALAIMHAEQDNLEKRMEEAEQRKSQLKASQQDEAQRYEQERLELKIRLQQLAKERERKETEKRQIAELARQREEDDAARQYAELTRQQAEARARVEALRKKGSEQTELDEVLTLDQARKKVASARAEIARLHLAISTEQNKEISQIDSTYSARRQSLDKSETKDMFETTAQFAQRRQKQRDLLSDLNRRWEAAKAEAIGHYQDALVSQERPLQKTIDSLTARLYPAEPLPVIWQDYNADQSVLTVATGPFLYRFIVPPSKAKELYDRKDKLRLESKFHYEEEGAPPAREDVTLVDPFGDRFPKNELPLAEGKVRYFKSPDPKGPVGLSLAERDQVYWNNNRFDEFEVGASEELEAGSALVFLLQHHHAMRNVHPVRISVSREKIVFEVVPGGLSHPNTDHPDTPPSSCDLDRFSADVRNVVFAEVKSNKEEEIFLTLKIREGGSTGSVRSLSFADQYSSKKQWVSKGMLGVGLVRRSVRSRPEAERALLAIQHTIQRAAAQARAIR